MTRLYLIYVTVGIMYFHCSISWRTTRAKKINCAVLFIFLYRQMEDSECIIIRKKSTLLQFIYCAFTENELERSVGMKRKCLQKLSVTQEASRRPCCLTKFLDVPNIYEISTRQISRALSYKSIFKWFIPVVCEKYNKEYQRYQIVRSNTTL